MRQTVSPFVRNPSLALAHTPAPHKGQLAAPNDARVARKLGLSTYLEAPQDQPTLCEDGEKVQL